MQYCIVKDVESWNFHIAVNFCADRVRMRMKCAEMGGGWAQTMKPMQNSIPDNSHQ